MRCRREKLAVWEGLIPEFVLNCPDGRFRCLMEEIIYTWVRMHPGLDFEALMQGVEVARLKSSGPCSIKDPSGMVLLFGVSPELAREFQNLLKRGLVVVECGAGSYRLYSDACLDERRAMN